MLAPLATADHMSRTHTAPMDRDVRLQAPSYVIDSSMGVPTGFKAGGTPSIVVDGATLATSIHGDNRTPCAVVASNHTDAVCVGKVSTMAKRQRISAEIISPLSSCRLFTDAEIGTLGTAAKLRAAVGFEWSREVCYRLSIALGFESAEDFALAVSMGNTPAFHAEMTRSLIKEIRKVVDLTTVPGLSEPVTFDELKNSKRIGTNDCTPGLWGAVAAAAVKGADYCEIGDEAGDAKAIVWPTGRALRALKAGMGNAFKTQLPKVKDLADPIEADAASSFKADMHAEIQAEDARDDAAARSLLDSVIAGDRTALETLASMMDATGRGLLSAVIREHTDTDTESESETN